LVCCLIVVPGPTLIGVGRPLRSVVPRILVTADGVGSIRWRWRGVVVHRIPGAVRLEFPMRWSWRLGWQWTRSPRWRPCWPWRRYRLRWRVGLPLLSLWLPVALVATHSGLSWCIRARAIVAVVVLAPDAIVPVASYLTPHCVLMLLWWGCWTRFGPPAPSRRQAAEIVCRTSTF